MSLEKLDTSDKYKDDIGKIRSLPQGSNAEKEHKREKAVEFRMNVMFDNARIMDTVFASIAKNPHQTKKRTYRKT